MVGALRNGRTRKALVAAVLIFAGLSAGGIQVNAAETATSIMSLPKVRSWTGDFDGMLKRRTVRILVVPNKTQFFLDKGSASGVSAEFGLAFEQWVNSRYGKKPFAINIIFVPTRRDRLLDDLREGRGDIIAANLTITDERRAIVDFAKPWITGISELLITGPAAVKIDSIDGLAGRPIMVRKSSSYYTHLLRLNERFTKEGKQPIDLLPADEGLEDEDLLEMVNGGLLPWAVVDSHKAGLWARIFKKLTVRQDIVFNSGGEIAWAIRKGTPRLNRELAEFVETHKVGTDFGSDVRLRYFTDVRMVKNAMDPDSIDKLNKLIPHFQRYGGQFTVDPNIVAAQGYQESKLDQNLRVRSGAVGVMQIKPTTAREKEIGIIDVVTRAEDNIHAGTKYLRFLADKYVNEPGLDPQNRMLMALAAYNAGPGGLKKFREAARKQGYDPNVWFQNVEVGAASVGGNETVQYVGNVYKYFITYEALLTQREKAAVPTGTKPPAGGK